MKGKRYVWDTKAQRLVELSEAREEPAPRLQLMTDGHYEGVRATDGTPLDSRTKHRAYMKQNGLALADDYRQAWANAPQEKAKEAQRESVARREAIARALYRHHRKP